jgi:hypothetical protein
MKFRKGNQNRNNLAETPRGIRSKSVDLQNLHFSFSLFLSYGTDLVICVSNSIISLIVILIGNSFYQNLSAAKDQYSSFKKTDDSPHKTAT